MTTNIPPQQPETLMIEQTFHQAIAHHQAGRLQEAGELYLSILQTQPNHPEANHNMGVLAVQMKQPAAGLPYFMAALDADPAHGQYWLSYIDALFQAGQLEDARQVLTLAQQQGLQGEEVEAMAARLVAGAQVAEQTDAIPQDASRGSPPASHNGQKIPKAKPDKPGKSAGKSAPHKGKNPSHQEINALVALFTEGRLTEAATLARAMTERFPRHEFGWKALGAVFKQMGRSADALAPMQKAAMLSPGDVEAHYNLGVTLQDMGRLDEAEASYRRALRINPYYADAHSNLGATLQALGRLNEAEASLRQALKIKPDNAEAHSNLGVTLQELDRLDEAETSYRQALQLKPDNPETHSNLGITLQRLGRPDEAETSYRRALAINPDYFDAHCNLGITLHEMGRLEEAVTCFQRSLEIRPEYAEGHKTLGEVLKDMGRLDESMASFRRAIKVKPDYAEVHNSLGIITLSLGLRDEAEAYFRWALEIKPDYAEAHSNLGVALRELGRPGEAETCYRCALQINPDYPEAHNNLGVTLHGFGQLDKAEASIRRALQLNGDFVLAHINLGSVLQDSGRLDEAETSIRRALQLKPDHTAAHSNLLFVLNYHPDKSGDEIFEAYREYDAKFGLPHRGERQPHGNSRETNRRLKVGYVSPDFWKHSVRHFLEPLLAHHDKNALEIYAYAELAREDEVTTRYKGYVDHWVSTAGMGDATLAERIRADGIDVLVDLAGHTAKNRLGVFAYKPAPISVSWLGYGYSTGLTAIDYLLTDQASAPANSEALFSEKPWRLATPGYVYRPSENMGAINPLPALSAGYVTFGTLSRGIRINHRVIRVWSEILKRVEGARLVIDSRDFREAYAQDILAKKFAAHGISRDRLQIGYHSPPWDVLRGIDIGLDCFPHNSGTTLFETLYMGIPYITLAGRPSVGRLGSSILESVGHPEWITRTEDEYVAKVVTLAEDLPKLAALRAGLRQEMQAGPLMDEPAFAGKVEAAYREMFEKWAAEYTHE